MRYAVVLADRELNPEILNGLPGFPGIPGTVPLVSGRTPAPFWFLSLSWFGPGGIGLGTARAQLTPGIAGPGTAGPGTAGETGVTGVTCSTCVRTVEGMSASLSMSLAVGGENN